MLSVAVLTVVLVRAALVRHTNPASLYPRTDMQADTLLIGTLAAALGSSHDPRKTLVPAACVSLAFVVVCVARLHVTSRFLYNGGYTLFAVAVAIIIVSIVESHWLLAHVLAVRPLHTRIKHNPEVTYLWHFFVIYVVGGHTKQWTQGERVIGSLAITCVVTLLSWYLVESPFLRLKRRPGKASLVYPARHARRRTVAAESQRRGRSTTASPTTRTAGAPQLPSCCAG